MEKEITYQLHENYPKFRNYKKRNKSQYIQDPEILKARDKMTTSKIKFLYKHEGVFRSNTTKSR